MFLPGIFSSRIIAQFTDGDLERIRVVTQSLRINGLSFPYELSLPLVSSPTRQQPQAFVLDAGSMGVMGGLFFFEDNNLYLEIDSQVRIFSRVQP